MNKGFISLLLVLVLLVSLMQPISVHAADSPTIEVLPSNTNPQVGDVFTYDIFMKGITNFSALQVTLYYDPDVLKLVDTSGNVTEDPSLFTIERDTLGKFAYAGVQADNTNGLVDCTLFVSSGQADYTIQSQPGQPDENGFFIGGLRFKAIGQGCTSVQLAVAGAANASGNTIPWNEANTDGYIYIDTLDNAFEGITTDCHIPAMSNVVVHERTAELSSVATKVDTSPQGGNGSSIESAITWEIFVDYAKAVLAPNDIAIAGNATTILYMDSGFTSEITNGNSLPLTTGGATVAYIKVTDEDTSSAKYYAVTINRASAPVPAVNSVTVTPEAASVEQGRTKQLTATVDVVGGAAQTVNWSSSDGNGKVTVNGAGLVTVAADAATGNYTITATSTVDGTKTDTSIITVTAAAVTPAVNSVTVEPSTANVTLGTTQQLIAIVDAVGGAAQTVNWTSSDGTGKVTVNAAGLVTVAADAATGNYTITATSTVDGTKTDTSTITVTAEAVTPEVNSVILTPEVASVVQGDTQQLTATVVVVGGAAETVNWTSSDVSGKVSVDGTGLVTVATDAATGNYTITATSTVDGTKTDTSIITVTEEVEAPVPAINNVTVTPATASVAQGGTRQLTATVDVVGGAAQTVNWTSSDVTGKITVNAAGLVTVAADAATGNYTITATSTVDGTKTDTSIITVTAAAVTPAVNSVTVEPSTATVTLGTTQQLIVTVNAVGGANETVNWTSSDVSGKVLIDGTGLVTVATDAAIGDYTITATSTFDGSKSDTSIITVTSAAVTPSVNSVIVTPSTATVTQGGIQQLNAAAVVIGGADNSVTWTSSDVSGKVTVDGTGLVAVAADAAIGDYTITVTSTFDGSKSDTSIITVTAAAILDITAPTATLTAPEAGTRTQLVVSFDEALNSSTLAIDNVAGLLSAATSDAAGTGMISLSGGAGTVTWDTSDVNAPKAIIKLPPTVFTLGKTVRLNFLDGVVKDLQDNAILQMTNIETTVIADTTPPKVTIIEPIKGANNQLVVAFDEELFSTSITNITNLLSSITYDVDGANVPISVASVASSVIWDKTDPYAPKATIKIPLTLFELDKKVRLNFKLNEVKDKAGNAIDPVQNFEVEVVDNEITSDVYIIDNQKMIIRGLDATWKTNSATSVVNFKNNIATNGGSLTLIKRDGSGDYTSINIGSGVKVSLSGSSKVYTVMLYGDTTGDGSINAQDLAKLKTHLQSSSKITDEDLLKAANINKDAGGLVNVADLLMLKTHLQSTIKINQK